MMSEPKLGFGVMRLPFLKNEEIDMQESERMFNEYMKGDFCYFDTHPAYVKNQSQKLIKNFVVDHYPRDSFMIASKMPFYVRTKEGYPHFFKQSLNECGVEYFDYYLLHAITGSVYKKHEKMGGFSFLEQMKREGKIKHIGFSFHDSPELLDEILKKHSEIEFVQLQINFLDWDDSTIQSRKLYEIARYYEKKIFVMKPIKGGSLANLLDFNFDFNASISDFAELALRFVASLNVDIILSGMTELEHVINNRKTFSNLSPLTEDDLRKYDLIREAIKKSHKIQCTSCHYCERECIKKIPIPNIISLLNACGHTGINDKTYVGRFKIFYNGYVFNKGKASDCIKCGKCEMRCPQKIEIRKHIQNAAELFEEKNG